MKVSEILQVKGNILYTATPEMPLVDAVNTMAEKDIGSLVVMEHGDLVGLLTFREVIQNIVGTGGVVGVLEGERGREINRGGAGAGGRVGRGAGMQRQGVEAGVVRTAHGGLIGGFGCAAS